MRAATVLLAALAACSSRKAAEPVPVAAPPPGSAAPVAARSPIPADATQLLTTVVADWRATSGTMQLWHRARGTGAWRSDGPGWPVVVGKTGTAWGRGLHGDGAPAGHAGPAKREGDGAAPAGAFELRGAYGYAAAPPPGTALPYARLADDTECVDDPASRHYTQILARGGSADWASAEHMRRSDALYTWVVDVAHNPDAVAGAGSCIFLHVWQDAQAPTVGCTAMPEPRLAALLGKLAPAALPVYVLLPRAEYVALAPAWGLPAPEPSANVAP